MDPETAKAVGEAMTRMFELMSHKTDLCFRCGKQVTSMQKIGRCVYARPCGCRLWQGTVPAAWKPAK
jgi:hypothetical protein